MLMPSSTQTAPAWTRLWVGRVISALMIVLMLIDAGIKTLKLPAAVEGTVRLGYPASTVLPIGVIALVCVLLYGIPRTSILGAILLTGYFGGATATQVRVQDAWYIFPPVLDVLIWVGLYLRDDRLCTLIPLHSRKEN
jgi:hypothetical protein